MQYIILCLVIKADDWYYLWMRIKPSLRCHQPFPKNCLKRSRFAPFCLFKSLLFYLIQSDGTKVKMLQCDELT